MSHFRNTKPDPNDGRFDDIDDEDPMEGVEVSEELLRSLASKSKTQAGARETLSQDGDADHNPFAFLRGPTEQMGDLKMFEKQREVWMGFGTGKKVQSSNHPRSDGGSTESNSSSSILRKYLDSETYASDKAELNLSNDSDADKFSSNQSSDNTKPSVSGNDWFTNIFGSKRVSDTSHPEDSDDQSFASLLSRFGTKKTASQNFEIENYEQPPKIERIDPDPCSFSPMEFLMRFRRGKERSRRGYFRIKDPQPFDTPKPENHTRFVCVSDTHNEHGDIELPEGDVLLHCGDFTLAGRLSEVDDFNKWLGDIPYEHKIVIAGNHELSFDPKIMEQVKIAKEKKTYVRFGKYLKPIEEQEWRDIRSRLTNCTYLEDNEVTINGIRIWGSPWQPEFGGWGFNLARGRSILDKWDKIPDGVDILMTHGPPVGHGDTVVGGQSVGCVDLLNTIQLRVQPKYHIFGHIHEGYGISSDKFTTYVNCSSVNYHYQPIHKPIVFDLPNKVEE